MKIVNRKISELIPAEYNPRKMTEKDEKDITESLTKFGFVDPLIVNINPERKNIIIGGHQRLKIWQKLGHTTIPTTELNLSYEQERELNIRLNKNTGRFDYEILSANFNLDELESWGFDKSELEQLEVDSEDLTDTDSGGDFDYTHKIKSPIYEIKGEKPELSDILDEKRADELTQKIMSADIPNDVRVFLIKATKRFYLFNYHLIAEYYAHSDKNVQELFEDLALVIVDFNKAIEDGFVQMSENIANQYADDYDEKF